MWDRGGRESGLDTPTTEHSFHQNARNPHVHPEPILPSSVCGGPLRKEFFCFRRILWGKLWLFVTAARAPLNIEYISEMAHSVWFERTIEHFSVVQLTSVRERL
jgi:hypothetical protein